MLHIVHTFYSLFYYLRQNPPSSPLLTLLATIVTIHFPKTKHRRALLDSPMPFYILFVKRCFTFLQELHPIVVEQDGGSCCNAIVHFP